MPKFLTAVFLAAAFMSPSASHAQPVSAAAKKYVSVLVGQQILYACGTVMTQADDDRIAAALGKAGEAQTEIPLSEVPEIKAAIKENFLSRSNRGDSCAKIKEMGADTYIDAFLLT